ncbi:MAG: Hpt domain-containing protein [Bacteriovoracaceae bacterium]|nr:Hpt domain-containing protein [Bacteriovoracaceae bacterium]
MQYKKVNGVELKRRFRGDEEILKDMIDLFIEHSDDLVENIHSAITTEDGVNLKLHAHTMKGILNNFYAIKASQISYELEILGLKKNFSVARETFEKLEEEIDVILSDLLELKSNLNSNSNETGH